MEQTASYAILHLITGGSGSGKSAYAENCIMAASEAGDFQRVYIATMIPYGEEGRQRVDRHRRLRARKGFETVECYTGLDKLELSEETYLRAESGRTDQTDSASPGTAKDVIESVSEDASESYKKLALLECMSNLVANEMFEPDGAGEDTVNAILRGIEALRRQTDYLVIVTNEVFSDGITYDSETMRYLSYLGAVNQALAAQADAVTEVVYGIPVVMKDNKRGYTMESEDKSCEY